MTKIKMPSHLLPDPDRMEEVAVWLDEYDERREADDSVQQDMRAWAKTIREAGDKPIDELLLPDPALLEMLADWSDKKALKMPVAANELRTWASRLREFGVNCRFKPTYKEKHREGDSET